jgi:outer membrane receptor protein involved in Fe transport
MLRKVLLLFTIFLKAAFSQVASSPPAPPAPAQATPVHTESVIVTGTFLPVPLSESDRSVVSFDTREQSLLFSYGIDYLELDPSVDLQQRAPAGVQADLTILGSTFAETLVLLNGLRLNDAQTAHHDLDIPVPLEAVSRIEVLHGTGSTTYGADATAGAVNFITAPVRATELRVRLGVGNYGYNQEHVLTAFLIKNWSETIAADRDFSTGFRRDRDFRSGAASSETRFWSRLGETGFLFAGSDRPFGADQFYGNFPSWERTKNWYASVQQDLGPKTTAAFAYRRHSDEFVLIRDHPEIYENNHIDGSWQATLRRHESLGDHSTFSYGAEGQGDAIESNNLGQHARNREAVYANFDFRYLRRFSFSPGGREELFSGGNHVFTPTIAGGWWLKPAFKLRASLSRGFRAPTYTDLYYSDPTTVGNAFLKPEASWGIEAGGDWNPSDRIAAGATYFQRRDSNVIDYVRFAPGQRFQATNIQRLNFNGVEAHLGFRLHHEQHIQLAYTFLHGDAGLVPGAVSRYVFNYPSNKASFTWTGSVRECLVARTRVGINQRVGHEAYPVWDVAIARKVGMLRPYIQITNLSNTGYVDIPNVIMPSRTLVVGVELAFVGKAH